MNPSPRPPFDQGLFLTHFNKGKDFFEQKRFEEAERELEEAYLLRPRDQKVLNLLGLVYFKQDKFEKAEEVYRKLATESPEAHTLFYNLGLIYFKLNRLDEAESSFVKALELTRENPKINFYLGSIYERQHRFQDAIFQYRQAGASIMVRRVEDKLAAGVPARPSPLPAAAPGRPRRPEDTAEFKLTEIRASLKRQEQAEAALLPEKTVQPVSEVLLATGAPRSGAGATAPAADTLPPLGTGAYHPPGSDGGPQSLSTTTLPPSARSGLPPRLDVFRFLEDSLMEVNVSGKVFIKQGTIYSYSGNLTFWVKERRPGGHGALVIVTGTGRLILTDHERQITFMHVDSETVFVEPGHLLACEETLTPRYVPVAGGPPGLEFVVLEGRGMLALSVMSRPLPLTVTREMPVSVPVASVISWTGSLTPCVVDDAQVYEAILPPGSPPRSLIRLEGQGRLLTEQAPR